MTEWKLVPVKVTDAMRHAGFCAYINRESGVGFPVEATADAVWQAMLAAAPPRHVLEGDGLVAWLRHLAEKGGKGGVNNVDARSLGRCADRIAELEEENQRLTEDVFGYEERHRDRIAALEAALKRQCDNMAFTLSRVELYGWSDRFSAELERDRAALASASRRTG